MNRFEIEGQGDCADIGRRHIETIGIVGRNLGIYQGILDEMLALHFVDVDRVEEETRGVAARGPVPLGREAELAVGA
jgi:hypothetical protein